MLALCSNTSESLKSIPLKPEIQDVRVCGIQLRVEKQSAYMDEFLLFILVWYSNRLHTVYKPDEISTLINDNKCRTEKIQF